MFTGKVTHSVTREYTGVAGSVEGRQRGSAHVDEAERVAFFLGQNQLPEQFWSQSMDPGHFISFHAHSLGNAPSNLVCGPLSEVAAKGDRRQSEPA